MPKSNPEEIIRSLNWLWKRYEKGTARWADDSIIVFKMIRDPEDQLMCIHANWTGCCVRCMARYEELQKQTVLTGRP